jgi:creatinine amidohydrolase
MSGVKKVRLAEVTAAEAKPIYAAGPVVLIPAGSLEDQGPHAPMGDYLSADHIAGTIAEACNARGVRTLVTPAIPFGVADNFASNPGGIAIDADLFRQLLSTMIDAQVAAGASQIVLINGHGGNVQPIHDVTLACRKRTGMMIPSLYLWRMAYILLADMVGAEAAKARSGHGADPLSSVTAHLFPDLCRPDLMPDAPGERLVMGLPASSFSTVRFRGIDVALPLEAEDVTSTGVKGGNPRLSSAETGKELVEQLVSICAEFIEKLKTAA